jgi:hypothetical protein
LQASAQSTLLLFFFCHTFCNPPYIHSVVFSKPLFQSTRKSKKTLCIPTATTMHACARKKTTQSYYT